MVRYYYKEEDQKKISIRSRGKQNEIESNWKIINDRKRKFNKKGRVKKNKEEKKTE